jgi:transporter family-2 protein
METIMGFLLLEILLGLFVGMMMTMQGIINTALASKVGTYGSILILTIVNLLLVGFIVLVFPKSISLQNLPGLNKWYLYLGGVLGIFILTLMISILPRIGATLGFMYIIIGQLVAASLVDHFGLLGMSKRPITITNIVGTIILLFGAYLLT